MNVIVSPKTYKEVKDKLPNNCVVSISPSMDDRWVKEKWYPPPPKKFTELGPEDEIWAKYLGLGYIEHVDIGPLIISVTIPPKMTPLLKNYLNPIKYGF